MVTKSATVRNKAGIHVRPSGVIYGAVNTYPGKITLKSGDFGAGLTNVLALISMGLRQGAQVDISVDGPDEEAICDQLVELFERIYDFPPRT